MNNLALYKCKRQESTSVELRFFYFCDVFDVDLERLCAAPAGVFRCALFAAGVPVVFLPAVFSPGFFSPPAALFCVPDAPALTPDAPLW